MRATAVLLQRALRLTVFTRAHCSLCDDAKAVLWKLREKRDFEYAEVDVMATGNREWKDLYEFDTPVVHIDRATELKGKRVLEGTTAQAKKLMHRFTEAQMQAAMDEMLPGANLSRTIARTPNLDWICVDTEHGNISDDGMHDCGGDHGKQDIGKSRVGLQEGRVLTPPFPHLISNSKVSPADPKLRTVAAIAACGLSPIVRVPEGQHWMIKRALDAGAHGIMVPLVRTVAEARSIASYSKFPPSGTRGLGSPFSMEKFHPELTQVQYFQQANDSTLVILQIETAEALESVGEIAAVPGIDVLLVGPHDLGNSIGHPVLKAPEYDAELEEAIVKIHEAAQAAGKFSAIYCGSGEQARKYADQGFNMVNTMNDVVALKQAFGGAVESARGSYLHAGVQGIKQGVEKMTSN
ncbi:hypothetical protein B0A55_03392 [Friedmanniomyces simplex]|uniref:HpcH/HpaI aldolase/citrate lyase domain-containing protein n=1 Tax=Friedmanniomyces simplex TaxID=329884 RepID=A0A4U0XS38_9PEZI|nr:hypothetical protein B0A55_03392 [Friedmanniomyces simplex]